MLNFYVFRPLAMAGSHPLRALACLVFEISTVIHVFIPHCVVSSDWVRGRDRMQLGAANRVTCSANEELYPVKWDRMLVKG